MRAIFALSFYLLLLPLVFAHEHTNAVPEIDRKFLDCPMGRMSRLGQQPPSRPRNPTSALSPKANSSRTLLVVRFVPTTRTNAPQQTRIASFDHLVGAD